MARTGLLMNWTGVQAVTEEVSPVTTTLTKITDVEIDGKSTQKAFYGDANSFPIAIRNVMKTRTIKLVGGDVKKLLAISEDTPVTITAILNDLVNGTGAGALTIVAAHAKRESSPYGAKNNEFGQATVTFHCYSADGTTDPITVTEAS